jgi:hypothetical protein
MEDKEYKDWEWRLTIGLRQGKYLINVRSVKEMPMVFGLLFACPAGHTQRQSRTEPLVAR